MPTKEIYSFLENNGRTREVIVLKGQEKKAQTAKELAEVVELGKGVVSTLKEKKKRGKDSKEELKT